LGQHLLALSLPLAITQLAVQPSVNAMRSCLACGSQLLRDAESVEREFKAKLRHQQGQHQELTRIDQQQLEEEKELASCFEKLS
jgi:hypothetical protein